MTIDQRIQTHRQMLRFDRDKLFYVIKTIPNDSQYYTEHIKENFILKELTNLLITEYIQA